MPVKEIAFTMRGEREVAAIFKSIRKEAEKTGQVFDKQIGPLAKRAAKKTEQAWSAAKRPLSATEKLAQQVARAQERAAKKAASAQIREANRAARATEQIARKEAATKDRRAKRAAMAERRIMDRAAARSHVQWRWERRFEQRKRHAQERMAFTHARRMARVQRGQRSLFFDYAMGAGRKGGGMLRGAAGMMGLGGAAAIGGLGMMAVGSAARSQLALRDSARRLSRKGGGAVSAESLMGTMTGTTLDVRGVKANDVAAGMERFVAKTGDVASAQSYAKTMAEISLATDTSAADIGDAMADLYEKFDIKTVDEMAQAMSVLAVQGKRGSFELSDAAKQFPKLAAAAQRLGIGKGVESLSVLGGLTQISRRATGSPEQAATALEATFRQLTAKAPELKKKGVNVFDKSGNARDIRDILTETISKVGGKDIAKKKVGLQKIFGDEGIRAISPLISVFADAVNEGKDGALALREEMDRAIDSSGALAEIQRDLAAAQEDSSARITGAWERFKIQVGEKALPALVSGMESLSTFVESTDFTGAGEAVVLLAKAAVSAAKALGLISNKSSQEQALEYEQTALEEGGKVMDAQQKKALIQADIAKRSKFVNGKLVAGEATPSEQMAMSSLDNAIAGGQLKASAAGGQATSARLFGGVKSETSMAEQLGTTFLSGVFTPQSVKSGIALDEANKGGMAGASHDAQRALAQISGVTDGLTGLSTAFIDIAKAAQAAAGNLDKVALAQSPTTVQVN